MPKIDREFGYLPDMISIWVKGYMRMSYFKMIRLAVKHRTHKHYVKARANVGALRLLS